MKKGVVILGLIAALGLSGCGSIPVSSSSSDDGNVIAQSKAVVEQSKAVVEESKAVVEESKAVVEESKAVVDESKAVEKAKGNGDTVEETEPEKTVSSSEEISHPFMILEYEGEKFDIAKDAVKDLVQFWQKMGFYYEGDLSKKLEPYTTADTNVECIMGVEWCFVSTYNPYDKEIVLKDAKIGSSFDESTIEFSEDIPENLKFLNGKMNINSSFEEWMEVFKEEAEIIWDYGAYQEARKIAEENGEKYTGPEPPEDEYANIISYDYDSADDWSITYEFRLNDGRGVYIEIIKAIPYHYINFRFDPYYE